MSVCFSKDWREFAFHHTDQAAEGNVIEDDAGKVNTQHCHEQGKVRKNLKPIMGAEGKENAFFCWGGTNA